MKYFQSFLIIILTIFFVNPVFSAHKEADIPEGISDTEAYEHMIEKYSELERHVSTFEKMTKKVSKSVGMAMRFYKSHKNQLSEEQEKVFNRIKKAFKNQAKESLEYRKAFQKYRDEILQYRTDVEELKHFYTNTNKAKNEFIKSGRNLMKTLENGQEIKDWFRDKNSV